MAHMILLVRGHKVMLDRDLALLYGIETRVLNQAVSLNLKRFPDDFIFDLTKEEIMRISQTVTSSTDLKYSIKVRAFTEQGVAMLSSVLRLLYAQNARQASVLRSVLKLGGGLLFSPWRAAECSNVSVDRTDLCVHDTFNNTRQASDLRACSNWRVAHLCGRP